MIDFLVVIAVVLFIGFMAVKLWNDADEDEDDMDDDDDFFHDDEDEDDSVTVMIDFGDLCLPTTDIGPIQPKTGSGTRIYRPYADGVFWDTATEYKDVISLLRETVDFDIISKDELADEE